MELADRLTEALGDRCRIEREIGSGGMATVFLAHDLKHDRAIQELQRAVSTIQTFNTWTIWAPCFRPRHDDPRHQTLVAPKWEQG